MDMRLSEYLKSNGISVAEFARLIGVKSRATIHRYIEDDPKSKRIPIQEIMERIHSTTSGQVTANDFYGLSANMNGHNKSTKKPKTNGKHK